MMDVAADSTPNPQTRVQKLQGWKEIAAYVDVAPRTAQDYERNLGLPVHRLPGQPRSRVEAFSDELDVWRSGHQSATDGETGQPVRPVIARSAGR